MHTSDSTLEAHLQTHRRDGRVTERCPVRAFPTKVEHSDGDDECILPGSPANFHHRVGLRAFGLLGGGALATFDGDFLGFDRFGDIYGMKCKRGPYRTCKRNKSHLLTWHRLQQPPFSQQALGYL